MTSEAPPPTDPEPAASARSSTPGMAADAGTRARRRAAALAGHAGDVAGARQLLDDPDPGVRATALRALTRAGAATVAEVTGAAADPDPAPRRTAAEVVAAPDAPFALDDPAVPPVLATLLGDDDPTVTEVAAWAIGEWVGRMVEADLALPSPDLVARLSAVAIDHADALCREAAVAALGAIGDDAALPTILAATRDKATVRRRAVIALAPFDGDEVTEALERAREDRDWQVRQAAEDLLLAGEADDADEDEDDDAG